MKGLSLSWIDKDALSVSLSRAGVAPVHPAFAPSGPVQPMPQSMTGEMSRPVPTGIADATASSSLYEPPDAPLAQRLEHYVRWVQQHTECHQIFIADADGLVLMEEGADPEVVAIAAMFVSVLNRVDASFDSPMRGSIAIDLEAGHSLHVVQAETGLGPHALGFAVSTPATRETIDSAREGLTRVLSSIKDVESSSGSHPSHGVS